MCSSHALWLWAGPEASSSHRAVLVWPRNAFLDCWLSCDQIPSGMVPNLCLYNVFSNGGVGTTWVTVILSAFQNAHRWALPRSIEPIPLGWEWSGNFHPWFSLALEPDRISQAEAGQEEWGNETPGRGWSWTCFWEPLHLPAQETTATEFPRAE